MSLPLWATNAMPSTAVFLKFSRPCSTGGLLGAQRTVTNLLERYDERLSLTLQDPTRLRYLTEPQGRVILALDGLQPAMGPAVLGVLRDCLSGEVLLAPSLLAAAHTDLVALVRRGKQAVRVPMVAVVSDGHRALRKAV
jgi:hypothetical protein